MESQNNDNLKRSAFGSMFWKFAERICAQLVSLIVSIILARMLVPDDYSVVSIVAIFFAFCYVFISGGMNTALIQKKNAVAEDYSAVLYVNLTIATVFYGAIYLCAPLIAQLYAKPLLTPIFRVMGLTFFPSALKSVLSAYIASKLEFRKFFLSTIVGTVISAAAGLWVAFAGYGAWALVAQEMTNTFIDTLVLYLTTRLRFVRSFSLERLKSLFAFGWKMMLTSIITVAYDQLSPLIVGLKFTPADLAYYNKGKTFPGLINNTISDTLANVLFPVMARVQDNKEDVLYITRRYVKVASYVMFPVMLGLFAVSENFIRVLLTDKWLPAVAYLQIFAVFYMFDLVQVGSLQAIKAIGRSDIILRLEIIKKVVYLTIVVLFLLLSRNPEMFAFSALLCMAASVVIDTYPNRKLLGYRYRYLLADVLPNLLISAIMAGVVLVIGRLQAAAFVLLLLQILTGVVLYVVLSFLTRNENFRYLLSFLLELRGKEN